VYMCICVYVYMCICVYVYMCICVYVYMCICVYVYSIGSTFDANIEALGEPSAPSDLLLGVAQSLPACQCECMSV
jgi:hypothetical protein